MVDGEVWIQATLFPDVVDAQQRVVPTTSPARQASGRRTEPASVDRRNRSAGWQRVTRDPAVALSYAQSAEMNAELRAGLAGALARLSTEQRGALRAILAGGRTAA
ncbi:MAG: hypothetical protein HYY04_08020 [Chloroflexi bacterium]|nr:hypothetical protein [Chloroflexota bacterium]